MGRFKKFLSHAGHPGMKWGKHLFGDRDYDPIGEEAKGPYQPVGRKPAAPKPPVQKNMGVTPPVSRAPKNIVWGSETRSFETSAEFLKYVSEAEAEGMSGSDLAHYMGLSTNKFRDQKAAAKNEQRSMNISTANDLIAKGASVNMAAQQMGVSEATLRSWLSTKNLRSKEQNDAIVESLQEVLDNGYLADIGEGVENMLGISKERLRSCVKTMETRGYRVLSFNQRQTVGHNKTPSKILVPEDFDEKTLKDRKLDIIPPTYRVDKEDEWKATKIEKPVSVDMKRCEILRADDPHPEGGVGRDRDGLIEIRRGVPDLSLGRAHYAQVRILVDNKYYLKGMAAYSDTLPPGKDIRFNTSKSADLDIGDVLKKIKPNPENPFGANVKMDDELILAQNHYTDANGRRRKGALNIVSEEGTWFEWSRSLPSQMLAKQRPAVIQRQLTKNYESKNRKYLQCLHVQNPAIRAKVLEDLAGGVDRDAVNLRGAAFTGQASHVIIPDPSIPENEIYAPNYQDGQTVVLVRYPHAGTFEIPQLKVNNKLKHARDMIGNAIDGVVIHPNTARKLSGADFDGDTVQVIPNNEAAVVIAEAQESLRTFDPEIYEARLWPDCKIIDDEGHTITKSGGYQEMGMITNLMTDMSLMGAPVEDIVRADKYSMVAIDAYKHKYNYKQAYEDLGIRDLFIKYHDRPNGGAKTVISRATADMHIPEVREARGLYEVPEDKREDWEAGKTVYVPTNRMRYDKKTGEWVPALMTMAKMQYYDDPEVLSGHTNVKEDIYVDYARKMKDLANKCRKEMRNTEPYKRDHQASVRYMNEVISIEDKVAERKKKSPLERRANIISQADLSQRIYADPSLKEDGKKLSKEASICLTRARNKLGMGSVDIDLTDQEWDAIFDNALDASTLAYVLRHCNPIELNRRAFKLDGPDVSDNFERIVREMQGLGYTRSQISEHTGLSLADLKKLLEVD